MIKCYSYYLIHIPTGLKYYGVRWANIGLNLTPEEDFWNVYFSSSEAVQLLLEQHGKESFRAEIRKLFDTKEEAQAWEHKVLRRMKAVQREDWLNKANYPNEFYCDNSGEKHPLFGTHLSEERKREMSERMSGEKNPMHGRSYHDVWVEKYGKDKADRLLEDKKLNNSLSMSGEKNPMYGVPSPMTGKHHDYSTKKLISIILRPQGYPQIISKEGVICNVEIVSDFAKKHGLQAHHLNEVINGKRKSHKGWKLYDAVHITTETQISRTKRNNIPIPELCSPNGEIIRITSSINEFAKKNNLHSSSLYNLIDGKAKQTKGWTLNTIGK